MEFGEIKRNTSNWSNFCMLLRRAGLTASAGLSCSFCDSSLLVAADSEQVSALCLSTRPTSTPFGAAVWSKWCRSPVVPVIPFYVIYSNQKSSVVYILRFERQGSVVGLRLFVLYIHTPTTINCTYIIVVTT